MADIINFKSSEVKETFENAEQISFNVKEMIADMKKRIDKYDSDDMIDIQDWDGECWKSFFKQVCSSVAEMYEEDIWDVFAVMMPMMLGTSRSIKGE